MTMAYYSEIDPFAAAWLMELIAAGHIAPGVVDTRSIEDVTPNDLRGFTQCHFFAGIGVWSLAARRAGWRDDEPLWTGSCPCQPFSAAGKGGGFADERHLWPAWFWLIEQCRPERVAGEQVASSNVDPWLDLVQADVEGMDYAFGCVPSPSAGYGAPHIRDRAFWVADANDSRLERAERSIVLGRRDGLTVSSNSLLNGNSVQYEGGLADAIGERLHGGAKQTVSGARRWVEGDGAGRGGTRLAEPASDSRPGPTNGLWRDADWLGCTDGKWRPAMPETFPLAHVGAYRNRVGTLRGAGNAINLAQAEAWMRAIR